jgi:hypothetical protein
MAGNRGAGYMVVIAIVIGAAVIIGGLSSESKLTGAALLEQTRKELCATEKGAIEAKHMAPQFIADKLLAPASAKYSPDGETFSSPYPQAGSCYFQILGYVDAQNAVTALIRQNYEVILEFAEIDNHGQPSWRAESVTLHGR